MSVKKTGLQEVNENTVCRHSDNFQYSLAALPLQAKRVLFLILAQIANPKERPEESELTFTITAQQFSEICCVDLSSSYESLDSAIRTLSTSFIYEDVSKGTLRRVLQTNITSKVIYHYDEGYCTVKINKDAYPYFFELSKSFTKSNLYEVARMPDKTLINFYQVISKRYSKSDINHGYKTEFIIAIDDMKDEMWFFTVAGKEKIYSYKEFKEFNRLLKGLCAQLSKYTSFKNVRVSIAEKRGRKATHLKISYQHADDIHKQEQRLLDEEEKRLGII
ncbi:RepB family plasmid replication initiator protein [Salmonella enterica subsp. enterica serovar Enteritidis]|nr:replication initiation protein [Salmonella enterica]ECT8230238.1 RepB family plasmid replication initiator protein [Salmonella enterica subsp. enterica serovar Enteritidis]EEW1918388.1 RepB family plasmid replication initiator protein [Escherichia coli]EHP6398618.1 replication initiation protein [Escherichia coli]EJY7028222.1 replication initiation protein [Escherichia coli]